MVKHYDHSHSSADEIRSCMLVTPKAYRTYTADGRRVVRPLSLKKTSQIRSAR